MRVVAERTLTRLEDTGVPPASVAIASAELTRAYLDMIEGQYLDLSFEHRQDVFVADYLGMISRKTGALFESAMFLGSLVATDNIDIARAFGATGPGMGIAFQVATTTWASGATPRRRSSR